MSKPDHSFRINLEDRHARLASRSFLRHKFGWIGVGAILLIAGSLALSLVYRVNRDSLLLLGGLLVIALLLPPMAYRSLLNRTRQLVQQLGDPPVIQYHLASSGLEMLSAMGEISVAWDSLDQLWVFEEVWLLFYEDDSYLILPLDQVSDDARRYLSQKIVAHGGTVKG